MSDSPIAIAALQVIEQREKRIAELEATLRVVLDNINAGNLQSAADVGSEALGPMFSAAPKLSVPSR